MRGLRISIVGLFLAVLIAVAGGAPTFAGQYVVIESTAPALAEGSVLERGQKITVPSGSSVSLLSDRGTVQTVNGPYDGAPEPTGGDVSDPSVVNAIASLFVEDTPQTKAWGTFRSASGMRGSADDGPPNVWAINLSRSESICLPSGAAPKLWRSVVDGEILVVLVHISSGREAFLRFPDGVQELAWPADLPLVDGGEYAIRDAGYLWERHISLRLIPQDRTAGAKQIAWMADTGCFRQAKVLLSDLK
jgi:hypothetical protein